MRTKAKHGITLPTASVSDLAEATRRELERVYAELTVYHSWAFAIPGPVVHPFSWQFGLASSGGDPVYKTMRNRKVVSLSIGGECLVNNSVLEANFYTVPGTGVPLAAYTDVARQTRLTATTPGLYFNLVDTPPAAARSGVENWGKDQGFVLSVITINAGSSWQDISVELTFVEFVPTIL